MCVFFPIITYLALALRPRLPAWKFVLLLACAGSSLVGMVASSSRGALFGGAAVMLFMLYRSKHKTRGLVAGVVVGAIVYLAHPHPAKATVFGLRHGQDLSKPATHVLEERH